MLIGYIVGSIVNSIWVIKALGLSDVRLSGSKNAGSTNVNRVHGKKVGLLVFVLDVLKPVVVMVLAKLIVGADKMLVQAAGIATVIGHIFPIFYKFKGGKGAACMLGVMITTNWTIFFIGAAIFFAIVLPTKKVSLGSLITPVLIMIIYISLSQTNDYNSVIFEPITYTYSYWINLSGIAISYLFVIFAHRQNIKRLLSGKENDYKT